MLSSESSSATSATSAESHDGGGFRDGCGADSAKSLQVKLGELGSREDVNTSGAEGGVAAATGQSGFSDSASKWSESCRDLNSGGDEKWFASLAVTVGSKDFLLVGGVEVASLLPSEDPSGVVGGRGGVADTPLARGMEVTDEFTDSATDRGGLDSELGGDTPTWTRPVTARSKAYTHTHKKKISVITKGAESAKRKVGKACD